MPTWPVHIEDWQYECCGEPFGVGDRVAWTLCFVDQGGEGLPDDTATEVTVVGRRSGEAAGAHSEIISTAEGVEIAVKPSETGTANVVRGTLVEEHHGGVPDDLLPVEGIVRRLAVVSQRFKRSGRALVPIAGTVRLRTVDRMPNAFVKPDDDTTPEQLHEIGALAHLELDVSR